MEPYLRTQRSLNASIGGTSSLSLLWTQALANSSRCAASQERRIWKKKPAFMRSSKVSSPLFLPASDLSSGATSWRKSPRCSALYAFGSKSSRVRYLRSAFGCMASKRRLPPSKPTLPQALTNCSFVTCPQCSGSMTFSQATSVLPCASLRDLSSCESSSSVSASREPKVMCPFWAESSSFHRLLISPYRPRRCTPRENSKKVTLSLPSRSNPSRQAPRREPQRLTSADLKPASVCRPTLEPDFVMPFLACLFSWAPPSSLPSAVSFVRSSSCAEGAPLPRPLEPETERFQASGSNCISVIPPLAGPLNMAYSFFASRARPRSATHLAIACSSM
mmetsp:Transcript_5893/g.14957  ORF Transcript_5893/g.14957 Transcript_5893/m.14957 type:complete len:334 (+) Transcript_5893:2076-3077(+)